MGRTGQIFAGTKRSTQADQYWSGLKDCENAVVHAKYK